MTATSGGAGSAAVAIYANLPLIERGTRAEVIRPLRGIRKTKRERHENDDQSKTHLSTPGRRLDLRAVTPTRRKVSLPQRQESPSMGVFISFWDSRTAIPSASATGELLELLDGLEEAGDTRGGLGTTVTQS